jgi:hypothetical protein
VDSESVQTRTEAAGNEAVKYLNTQQIITETRNRLFLRYVLPLLVVIMALMGIAIWYGTTH